MPSTRTRIAVAALVVLSLVAGAVPAAGASPTATVSVESDAVDVGDLTRINVTVQASGRTDGVQRLVVRSGNASRASIVDATSDVPGSARAQAFGDSATLTWSTDDVSLADGPVVLSMLVRGVARGEASFSVVTADGVERAGDGFYDVERRNGTVTVEAAPDEPDDGTDPRPPVGLAVPDVSLSVGETATIPVRVTGATAGVGTARLEVALPDAVRVEDVTTDGLSRVNVTRTTDGPLVDVGAVGYDASGPNVTVARIRVRGVTSGDGVVLAALGLIADLNDSLYEPPGGVMSSLSVSQSNGTEPAGPPALGADAGTAGDLDGDGRYEDVDGSGEVNVLDVSILLDEFESAAVREHVAAFDFTGDGTVDVLDVAELLRSL